MFKIGDQVRLVRAVDYLYTGSEGVILEPCEFLKDYQWVIRITKSIKGSTKGHYCDGRVPGGGGYFVRESALEKINIELPYDPKQQRDEEDDI
jgi:hypothetical protein